MSNPYDFNDIRSSLADEMNFAQPAEENLMDFPNVELPVSATEVMHKIEELKNRTRNTAQDLQRMEQEQELLALQYYEFTQLNIIIQQLVNEPTDQTENLLICQREKELLEQFLNQGIASLMQLWLTWSQQFKETHLLLSQLQTHVLAEELMKWKRKQALANNGVEFEDNLNTIQEWCESLTELIWFNRQQLKRVERIKQKVALDPPGITDNLPRLLQDNTQLLTTLVTSTLIIEKQPPQVMKTNTRFTSKVRLLAGGNSNVLMTPPQVKVTIISESQANMLLKNNNLASVDGAGEIINNTGIMECHQATRRLSVSLLNMQLTDIKRTEKKGTESVTHEKFALLFQIQFNIDNGELTYEVWTLSLPVVVIVHGNQEPDAHATITWDNAFSKQGRMAFTVPDKVPWCKVAETLSIKFRAATGRALTDDNLRFLAEKAFRGDYNEANNPMLSWAQFCKEPLDDGNLTFWKWFYAIMKLTKEHLRDLWVDGLIMGFVKKDIAKNMLSFCPCGTFLLRFSDSELGGITIAWISDTGEVFSVQPLTAKDFAKRALVDRVEDLDNLVYLYPDKPKNISFGKYYTTRPQNSPITSRGYVKLELKTHVPALTEHSSSTTPQHVIQSPDFIRDTPSTFISYLRSLVTPSTIEPSTSSLDYNDQQMESLPTAYSS